MRTLSAGEVRRALAESERGSKSRSGKGIGAWLKRGAIAAGVLLFVTLLTGWALGWYSTPPQVLEVRAAINEQIAELDKMSKGQTPYRGGPDMGRVRDSMRNLPEGMRDQVRRDFGRLMEAGETAQANSFFLVPPAQRQAELDRRIKAEDDARKKRAEDRAKGGNRGSPRGTAGAPPGGGRAGDNQVAGNRSASGGGTGGRGPGGGGPGGGGSSRGGFSEDDRNNRRKSMLDNSDPEQRGRRAEYRRQLEERRQQLGGGTGGRSR